MVTIGMAALVIGAVLAVVALANKKAKVRKNLGLWSAVLLIPGLIVLVAPGTLPFLEGDIGLGGSTLTTSPASVTTQDGKTICAVEDTTVTLSAINQFNTTATGGTHRYRLNGNPALTVSDAGTFTGSPGDVVDVLWLNGATTGIYFGDVSSFVIPCAGTKTFSANLVENGTITVKVFNEDNDALAGTGTGSTQEAIAAGDIVSLDIEIKGTFEKGLPFGGVIVAEWEDSTYDEVTVDFGGAEVNVPSFYSLSNSTAKTKTTTFPAILSNEKITGQLLIDADDTLAPSSGTNITLTVYPNGWFVNEENGGSFDGPAIEDEDDTQTTGHTTVYTVAVS